MSEIEPGLYIVFEGGEHTGKSTQARHLAERIGATLTREPGATALGQKVRSLLLDPDVTTTPLSEVYLFAADRADHIETVVRPSIESGSHVVSDRSWISSGAYQSARGIPLKTIVEINSPAVCGFMLPDITLLLDGDPEVLAARRDYAPDWFESMDFDFHHCVRNNFLEIGKNVGAHLIDATLSVEEIHEAVWQIVAPHVDH